MLQESLHFLQESAVAAHRTHGRPTYPTNHLRRDSTTAEHHLLFQISICLRCCQPETKRLHSLGYITFRSGPSAPGRTRNVVSCSSSVESSQIPSRGLEWLNWDGDCLLQMKPSYTTHSSSCWRLQSKHGMRSLPILFIRQNTRPESSA